MNLQRACLALFIALCSITNTQAQQFDFSISSGADYFRWTIAGNIFGTSPNILSELTWYDSYHRSLHIGFNKNLSGVQLQLQGNFGLYTSGKVQDSDYAEDNRQAEFSRSVNDAAGERYGFFGKASYPLPLGQSGLVFSPYLVYQFSRQTHTMRNGYQVVSDNLGVATYAGVPPVGPFDGLDSHYTANWQGFGPGLKINYNHRQLNAYIGVSYYWYMDYSSEANWNLRQNFQHPVSFEHFRTETNSDNADFYLGVSYRWNWRTEILLHYNYRHWWMREGLNKAYFASGNIGYTQVNEVEWKTEFYQLGLRYYLL